MAGSLLGGIKEQVSENVGASEADAFAGAIPELGQWAGVAKDVLGGADTKETNDSGLFGMLSGGGGAGGLLGAAAGMLGGQQAGGFDIGSMIGMLGKFNLDASNTQDIGSNIVDFLKNRLSSELMEVIGEKIPMLSVFTGKSGGGIAGMLGGLLK